MFAGLKFPIEEGTGTLNIQKIVLKRYLDVVDACTLDLRIGTPRVPVDALHAPIGKIQPAPLLRGVINLFKQFFRQVAHQNFTNVTWRKCLR